MATYAIRDYKPVILVKGKNNTISISLVDIETGELFTPTSVTVTVANAQGELITSGSATLSGTTISYIVTTAHLSSEDYSNRCLVEWTEATITQSFRQEAFISRTDFHCPIIEADLLREEPALAHLKHKDRTMADIEWTTFIQAAYEEMYGNLLRTNRFPHLILSSYSFRTYLINLALYKIFRSLSAGSTDSPYNQTSIDYKEQAKECWANITMTYDIDNNNRASPDETGRSPRPTLYVYNGPRMGR